MAPTHIKPVCFTAGAHEKAPVRAFSSGPPDTQNAQAAFMKNKACPPQRSKGANVL